MSQPDTRQRVTILLPPPLRQRAGNRARVEALPGTVRAVIEQLEEAYPGLRFHLCLETGELRPYVNIFLGVHNVRFLRGLETPVPPGAVLAILQSVAGG